MEYTARETLLIMLGELNNWASYIDDNQYTRKQAATMIAENIMTYMENPQHLAEREIIEGQKVLCRMRENGSLFLKRK